MTEPPLTEDEAHTLKAALFGAVYLVANVDPGLFNVLRESFAASGALTNATGLVRQVLTSGTLPRLPKSPPVEATAGTGASDITTYVMSALRESVVILSDKAPEELEKFRAVVTDAVDRVAAAADGVSQKEEAMIAIVKEALGA